MKASACGVTDSEPVPSSCTAASLFKLVWEAMTDVLGSAATATLMRRSVRRAAERRHDLDGVIVRRNGFDYAYSVPAHWEDLGPDALEALRALATELSPLLVELTGPVIIRRLSAIPELKRCDISFPERVR